MTSNQPPLQVFVYGTLKPGEENYPLYCEKGVTASLEAIAFGTLYALPMGYPALASGTDPVHGYLLTFAGLDILPVLDELEDYQVGRSPDQNEYERDWIEVWDRSGRSLGQVWVYRMSHERARAMGGVVLKTGCWTGQIHKA